LQTPPPRIESASDASGHGFPAVRSRQTPLSRRQRAADRTATTPIASQRLFA